MVDMKHQLDIARIYADAVGSPMEIDKEKNLVYLVDHNTNEWVTAEEILNKYFERVDIEK